MRVPPPVQALAWVLFALLAYLHVNAALGFLADGALYLTAAHALLFATFGGALAWVGVRAGHAGRVLQQRAGLYLDDGAHVFAALLQFAFLYLIFGLTVLATADGLQAYAETGENPAGAGGFSPNAVLAGLIVNLILFVLAAASWLFLVEGKRGQAMVNALGLQAERLPRGIGYGLLTTLAILVVGAGIGLAVQALGVNTENPQAEAIAAALTPQLAVAVGLLAGLGEEIYFRGFLQPRIGTFWQAALFGAIHATYLTPLQVLLPFLLGLAFGVLRERVGLWAPIVAHASYNAIVLVGVMTLQETALL